MVSSIKIWGFGEKFGVSEEKSKVFNENLAAPMKSWPSYENLELVSNENLGFKTKSVGFPMKI